MNGATGVLSSGPGAGASPGDDGARERYLAAALDVMRARVASGTASSAGTSFVSMTAVARVAGVRRESLYRVWPAQEEFWADLSVHLAATDQATWVDHLLGGELGQHLIDHPVDEWRIPLDELHALVVADRRPALRGAEAAQARDTLACRLIGEAELRRVTALGHYLAMLVPSKGRTFLPGVEADDLAVALLRLADGLSGRGQLRPDLLAAPIDPVWSPEPGWSLFGYGFGTLFLGLTETGPPATHARSPRWLPRRVGVGAHPGAHTDDRSSSGSGDASPGLSAAALRYLEVAAAIALGEVDVDADADEADHSLRGLGITIAELARSTGTSRRAIYRVWNDQAQMRLDVFAHLCREHWRINIEAMTAGILASLVDGPPEPADLVLAMGAHLFAEYHDNPEMVRVQVSYPHLREPEVRDRIQGASEAARTHTTAGLEAVLGVVGGVIPPPYSADLLGYLFLVHGDACVRMLRTTPSADSRTIPYRSGAWPLFAITSQLLAAQMIVARADA